VSIRVLIADDQALVRSGFRLILETRPDISVVGEAEDGRQTVALAREQRPDVILMDVRMPVLDGIQATREIVETDNPARILVLTTFDLDEYVYAAIRAGASGFLLKDVRPRDLIDAIRLVADGNALLGPTVTRRLLDRFAEPRPQPVPDGTAIATMTSRELEILRLLAGGLSNAEIAAKLFLGEATVKTHVSSILRKLGVRDRVQAVIVAFETGLVTPQLRESPGEAQPMNAQAE
jgi:DNA-binding NarL/FixJ family response regulator